MAGTLKPQNICVDPKNRTDHQTSLRLTDSHYNRNHKMPIYSGRAKK